MNIIEEIKHSCVDNEHVFGMLQNSGYSNTVLVKDVGCFLNPIALRKAKIVYNFGLSECNRVKVNQLVSALTN